MIELASLPGIAAAGLGLILAVLSVLRMREAGPTPTLAAFAATCVLLATTSAAYVVGVNVHAPSEVIPPWSVADMATWLYWTAGAASGVAWFCFGASLHGYWRSWNWAVKAALVIPAVAFASAAASLPHARAAAEPGAIADQPLLIASLPVLVLLAGSGTFLVLTSPTGGHRIQRGNRVIGVTSALALLTALAWDAQLLMHVRVTFDLMPISFALFSTVLGHYVFAGQFFGISRTAAGIAFENASDALMALDRDLHIVALNRMATRLFPSIQIGEPLSAIRPSLARHLRTCLEGRDHTASFDVAIDDAAYLGKVTRARSALGGVVGCVLVLTDVTDLRRAQRAVARLDHRAVERAAGD